MARLLSPIVSIMRGSVGGITFTANTFHQIVARARTAPVQPGTNYQSMIRSAFTTASVAWRQMTEPNRQLWREYAKTVTYTGPLGTYQIPGRSMFISNYAYMYYFYLRGLIEEVSLPTPPDRPGLIGIGIGPTTAPATGIGYKIKIENPNDEAVVCIMTRSWAYGETKWFHKGPFLSFTAQSVLIPANISATVQFTGLVVGLAYFNMVRLQVDGAPLRLSNSRIVRALAVAAPA